jgi:hypothetical protein
MRITLLTPTVLKSPQLLEAQLKLSTGINEADQISDQLRQLRMRECSALNLCFIGNKDRRRQL